MADPRWAAAMAAWDALIEETAAKGAAARGGASFEDVARKASDYAADKAETGSDYLKGRQLNSSNVYSYTYEEETRQLTVNYKGGDYLYFNISPDMVHALATAGSPGQWANANLRGLPAQRL
jgi:hypothetical protein